jgi:hypothetical protein
MQCTQSVKAAHSQRKTPAFRTCWFGFSMGVAPAPQPASSKASEPRRLVDLAHGERRVESRGNAALVREDDDGARRSMTILSPLAGRASVSIETAEGETSLILAVSSCPSGSLRMLRRKEA